MKKSKAPTISLYGNVAIGRGYCTDCETTAFIQDGKLACCGKEYTKVPKKFHREAGAPQRRKLPPKAARERILEEQENCCFYCGVEFGELRWKKGRAVRIKLNWDHKLPYAYSQDNNTTNFVAACHVCNGIKSSRVFQTVEEAQIYLQDRRKAKGYDF